MVCSVKCWQGNFVFHCRWQRILNWTIEFQSVIMRRVAAATNICRLSTTVNIPNIIGQLLWMTQSQLEKVLWLVEELQNDSSHGTMQQSWSAVSWKSSIVFSKIFHEFKWWKQLSLHFACLFMKQKQALLRLSGLVLFLADNSKLYWNSILVS